MDFDEKDCNPLSYFGDQKVSYLSFNKFFCKYIGGNINLRFQGLNATREEKILHLISVDWFRFNSSCYMNWNNFKSCQNDTKINVKLNMCGSCWKCKEDIEILSGNSFRNLVRLWNF